MKIRASILPSVESMAAAPEATSPDGAAQQVHFQEFVWRNPVVSGAKLCTARMVIAGACNSENLESTSICKI